MANRFEASVAKAAPAATRAFPLRSGGVSITYGSDLPIVLHCRHAGFSNPGVSSAMLKSNGARRKILAIEDDLERFKAGQRLDAKTLSHAVESWDNVLEGATPLPCTAEAVEELLLAIVEKHPDLFQRWKGWVGEEIYFVDAPAGDPADLGK